MGVRVVDGSKRSREWNVMRYLVWQISRMGMDNADCETCDLVRKS